MKKCILIALVTVFCLTSCATSNVARRYTGPVDASKGVVIGSVSRTNVQGGAGIAFAWRSMSSSLSGKVNSESGPMRGLFSEMFFKEVELNGEGTKGEVFVIELPAGEYEFFKNSFSQGNYFMTSTNPFSIPFKVVGGEIIYIGEINVHRGNCIRVRDKSSRDISVARKQYPSLKLSNAKVMVSAGQKYGSCSLAAAY